MPNRLSKLFSPSDKEKEALAEAERQRDSSSSHSHSPPPGYEQTESNYRPDDYDRDNTIDPPDITAGFSNLNISKANDGFPVTEEVIAHLKLLECFYRLKQSIASQDGLFGIYNELVTDHGLPNSDKVSECLAKLAEKRWATFVQRAVERYETWLQMMTPDARRPSRSTINEESRNGSLVESDKFCAVGKHNLPPVDVLMVWHAHMLNPRAYLEDCIRQGRMDFWRGGMPWSAVAESIDSDTFIYNARPSANGVSEPSKVSAWDSYTNIERVKFVKCHRCNADNMVPWTTCTNGRFNKMIASPDGLLKAVDQMLSSGEGFSDKDFEHSCHSCRNLITHDGLQAGKLCRDIDRLLKLDEPLGGTVLGLTGVPTVAFGRKDEILDAPNQLFLNRLGGWILTDPAGCPTSVNDIRDRIEEAMSTKSVIRKARGSASGVLTRKERIGMRKMMSRYWDNSGPFALDLVGAVVRQGNFIEKMHNIDWLHSPALPSTASRLIKKYEVFVQIMKNTPHQMAVPTLDVDLAWHSHQLQPYNYMKYTVTKCKQFIDHDDKVTETKLNESFAWTSKTYQKMTGMPYSECTCWYCEAIRESHTSAASRMFGTTNSRIADSIHAEDQDPRKSVHISAHNAVRPDDATHSVLSKYKADDLEKQYQKACERAIKKGKPAPKRDDYYYSDAYGYPVYIPAYSPYVGFVPYAPMYYPVTPGCMAVGMGAAGNCCSGTCGGGAAAGGCGSAASGACGGGAACGGSSGGGGCGGGGGGCGGGGGGGCGGGGGGC